MKAFFLALDAGTGSGRAVIYDDTGAIAGIGQQEWLHPPAPGVPGGLDFDAEENGRILDKATREAIAAAGISAEAIKAVSTTSMREGTVWFDGDGQVLWACPNIDSRASAEAQELTDSGTSDKIFDIAGDWVSITTAARIKWIEANQPDILKRARHFGLISDWAATRLTGEYFTEPSAGSSTGLFDLSKRGWSDEIFDLLGLDKSVCPRVVESGEQIGSVTRAAAERSGLAEATPVFAGGGDTQLALVGLGRRAGQSTLVGGTFWQMTQLLDRPLIDASRGPRTLCHARPGEWMIEGIGFLSGFSLRWLRDAFFDGSSDGTVFAQMEKLAEQHPVGANGARAIISSTMKSDDWIHSTPALMGFDLMDTEHTGRGAIVRAVMESGAYVTRSHLQMVQAVSGIEAESIQFTGGSSQSAVWSQIIADVLNRPLEISEVAESTALGCAILAAIGSGHFSDLADAAPMTGKIARTVMPDTDRAAEYDELHGQWQQLDKAMVSLARDGLTTPMWKAAGGRTK